MQELVHVRVAGTADNCRVAAVARDLAKTVEVELPDEAGDVGRLEDGPARVQVLRLEPLVIEQYRIAVRAPSDRPGLALVHYPPELLRESHRLQHAVLVHPRDRRWKRSRLEIQFSRSNPQRTPFERSRLSSLSRSSPRATFETNDCRITATTIRAAPEKRRCIV